MLYNFKAPSNKNIILQNKQQVDFNSVSVLMLVHTIDTNTKAG